VGNKISLNIIICVVFGLFVVFSNIGYASEISPRIILKVSKASYSVDTKTRAGSGEVILYSNKIFFVTCAHVCRDDKDGVEATNGVLHQISTLRPYTDENNQHIGYDSSFAVILFYSEKNDLAIYELLRKEFTNDVVELAERAPQLGEKIFMCSSPHGITLVNSITIGTASGFGRSVDNVTLDQTDAIADVGSSGGGVYNRTGKLIGIIDSITQGNNTFTLYIPVKRLKHILDVYIEKLN